MMIATLDEVFQKCRLFAEGLGDHYAALAIGAQGRLSTRLSELANRYESFLGLIEYFQSQCSPRELEENIIFNHETLIMGLDGLFALDTALPTIAEIDEEVDLWVKAFEQLFNEVYLKLNLPHVVDYFRLLEEEIVHDRRLTQRAMAPLKQFN